MSELSGTMGVKVYPNPATEFLFVSSLSAEDFILTDVTGRQVATGTLAPGKSVIGVESYSAGIYYLNIYGNNTTRVFKIIKQ